MAERIALIVLAAGLSRRFGKRNKLLAKIDGEPLIRRVVRVAMSAPIDDLLVVTGHQADLVRAALQDLDPPPRFLYNPDFAEGQSTSVRAAVNALDETISAALFLPGDQVGISSRLLASLIEARRMQGTRMQETAGVVVPVCEGERASPVLFGRRYFQALARLEGDVGGRRLLDALEQREISEVAAQKSEVEDLDRPDGSQLED